MRVVFDTNVIVAGLVARGLCHELIETHLPLHEVVLSSRMWEELVTVLEQRFDLEIDDLPFLALYRRHAVWVKPEALEKRTSVDPDDDWVLATATAGDDEVIVSGDDDLLSLGSYRNIRILTPRQFLEIPMPYRGSDG